MVRVPTGTNEITAIPMLLGNISLKGKIATYDAIGTQKGNVRIIIADGGDYVLALKGNQMQFHADVSHYLKDLLQGHFYKTAICAESFEKGHGRIEKRICVATDSLDWLIQKEEWAGLQSIVAVETTITCVKTGKISHGIRYFISSLPANADRLLSIIRGHWSIENKLHWHLDRHFDEDRSTIRDAYGAHNMSMLRSVAISVLHHDQKLRPNQSFNIKRQSANRNPNLITEILLNWA